MRELNERGFLLPQQPLSKCQCASNCLNVKHATEKKTSFCNTIWNVALIWRNIWNKEKFVLQSDFSHSVSLNTWLVKKSQDTLLLTEFKRANMTLNGICSLVIATQNSSSTLATRDFSWSTARCQFKLKKVIKIFVKHRKIGLRYCTCFFYGQHHEGIDLTYN